MIDSSTLFFLAGAAIAFLIVFALVSILFFWVLIRVNRDHQSDNIVTWDNRNNPPRW